MLSKGQKIIECYFVPHDMKRVEGRENCSVAKNKWKWGYLYLRLKAINLSHLIQLKIYVLSFA